MEGGPRVSPTARALMNTLSSACSHVQPSHKRICTCSTSRLGATLLFLGIQVDLQASTLQRPPFFSTSSRCTSFRRGHLIFRNSGEFDWASDGWRVVCLPDQTLVRLCVSTGGSLKMMTCPSRTRSLAVPAEGKLVTTFRG